MKTIKHNPYNIVRMFEEEVAEYTGAPFAISVDSCTNALFLCCKYLDVKKGPAVHVPRHTYLSVPMSVLHANGDVVFDNRDWGSRGYYQLMPYPIWDYAKNFTSGIYRPGQFQCISFHIKKQLGISKGGMILTDDAKAAEWFKKARYEGRSEVNYKNDSIDMLGWNMYMTPQIAAQGLALMQNYPENVMHLAENGGYRDLTEFPVFKECGILNE